jgi:hypothetical protein
MAAGKTRDSLRSNVFHCPSPSAANVAFRCPIAIVLRDSPGIASIGLE